VSVALVGPEPRVAVHETTDPVPSAAAGAVIFGAIPGRAPTVWLVMASAAAWAAVITLAWRAPSWRRSG
jgi:hypothetical protein